MATRHPSNDEDKLVSIGEAARRLGVSVDTVRRWEASGRIQATRTLGGQRRFLAGDLDALAAPA